MKPSALPEPQFWSNVAGLAALQQAEVISAIDRHFAACVAELVQSDDPALLVTSALASRAVQTGHVCLDLPALLHNPPSNDRGEPCTLKLPALTALREQLLQSPAVGQLGSLHQLPIPPTPLLLDAKDRLYLHRYAEYQARLAHNLRQRLEQKGDLDWSAFATDSELLFGKQQGDEVDRQRLAAFVVARNRFAVVSGGPGTGKTSTIVKLMLLLQKQALMQGKPALLFSLLAPTGKAAARLSEAITLGLEKLDLAQLKLSTEARATLTGAASTIHRALGYSQRTPLTFARNAKNPLVADVVIVDEASMIDLALMTKLVEAVHPQSRLILLGDKDQLASVEAGAILGDIFGAVEDSGFSAPLAREASKLARLVIPANPAKSARRDAMIHLTRSYRYAQHSGIAELANLVNEGKADQVLELLTRAEHADISWVPANPEASWRELPTELDACVSSGIRAYWQAASVEARLKELSGFRILCAHRRGPAAAETLNAIIERQLLVQSTSSQSYVGRPLQVIANDYQLELFNGDVGVIEVAADNTLRAFFPGPSGVRSFLPARLPEHRTVFAMTVHTSQGSEFDRVLMVLPPRVSPVLSRELLYTAITRARTHVTLYGSEAVLRACISRRIQRTSGLGDALWEE